MMTGVLLKISGIIWFEEIVDKIEWKHHVSTDEVEQLLLGKPHIEYKEKGSLTLKKMFMWLWAVQKQVAIYSLCSF